MTKILHKTFLYGFLLFILCYDISFCVRIVKRVKVRRNPIHPVLERRTDYYVDINPPSSTTTTTTIATTTTTTTTTTTQPPIIINQWCMGKINTEEFPVCTLRVHDCETHLGRKDITEDTEEIKCLRRRVFGIQRRHSDCWNQEDDLYIKCSAPFPIDVDFFGQGYSREFTPKFSKTLTSTYLGIITSAYNIVFNIQKDHLWSGKYSVYSVNNRTKETSLFLLMNGETQLPNLHRDELAVMHENTNFVTDREIVDSPKVSSSLQFLDESRMIRFCFAENKTGYAIDIEADGETHARHIARCVYEEKSCWAYDKNTSNRLTSLQNVKIRDNAGRLTWTSGDGCMDFYNRYDRGVFVQTSKFDMKITDYFYGLDKKIYTNASTTPPEALISIKISNSAKEFEDNKLYSFSCEIVEYVLVQPIIWYTKFRNGTYQEEKISEKENCPCYELLHISSEVEQVICAASYWNANRWVTASVDIDLDTNVDSSNNTSLHYDS